MNITHYIGLDVHKKHIKFCVKTSDGSVVQEGRLVAQRSTLREWAAGQTRDWHGAMGPTPDFPDFPRRSFRQRVQVPLHRDVDAYLGFGRLLHRRKGAETGLLWSSGTGRFTKSICHGNSS